MKLKMKIREIQELATNGNTYMRGRRYYHSNRIQDMTYDPADRTYHARIAGSTGSNYETEIAVTRTGRPVKAACSCPAFKKYHGCCKHLVAAMLLAVNQEVPDTKKVSLDLEDTSEPDRKHGLDKPARQDDSPGTIGKVPKPIVRPTETGSPFSFMKSGDDSPGQTRRSPKLRKAETESTDFLNQLSYAANRTTFAPTQDVPMCGVDAGDPDRFLQLECTLSLPVYSSQTASLSLRFGFPHKLYVVRNVESLLQTTLTCQDLHFGKFLVYRPLSQKFAPDSQRLFDWLLDLYQNDRARYDYDSAGSNPTFRGNLVRLSPARLRDFLELFLQREDGSGKDPADASTSVNPQVNAKGQQDDDEDKKAGQFDLFIHTAEGLKNRLVGRDFNLIKGLPPVYFELAEARWEERSYPALDVYMLSAHSTVNDQPVNLCQASTWKKEEPCFRLLSDDGGMIMDKDNLYLLPDNKTSLYLKAFYRALSALSDKPGLILSEQAAGSFLNLAGPQLLQEGNLRLTAELQSRLLYLEPKIELYLDVIDSSVTGKLLFNYRDLVINPHPDADLDHLNTEQEEHQIIREQGDGQVQTSEEGQTIAYPGKGPLLVRHTEIEQKVLNKLLAAGFKSSPPSRIRRADLPTTAEKALYYLTGNEAIFEFLTDGLDALKPLASIYYSNRFQKLSVQKAPQISGHIRLDKGLDLLSLDLEAGQMTAEEIHALLTAYREKRRFIRLKEGQFISLEVFKEEAPNRTDGLRTAAFETDPNLIPLLDKLDNWGAEWSETGLTMPSFRALSMDRLIRDLSLEADASKSIEGEGETAADPNREEKTGQAKTNGPAKTPVLLTTDRDYRTLTDQTADPGEVDFFFPEGIQANLRSYQMTGFRWFCLLNHYGFAGILADEMGLGKTLQALAFISYLKERIQLPSLVIAPTSLIYNWKEEAERFAPGLKTAVLTGAAEQRSKLLSEINQFDLVIASYTVQRLDSKQLRENTFACCILDEAQAIKNPGTHTARAVKKIKALRRFALTGTPIENSLHELWSIFDFLMPGYLLSHKKFQRRFEQPIIRDGDTEALADLNRLTGPFILRRLKKDVLKELPDKIETRLLCDMEPEQEKIYRAYLSTVRQSVTDLMNRPVPQGHKIEILSLLTRLRQICCHPSLFLENYRGGSGKLETLNELLDQLFENGSRVLLFSQFTTMLEIIRREQEKRNRPVFYIDGSVKSEDRIDQVNRFNQGERELFLISLRAGGTGLNLTGANAVIHYDPWWNPAVEQQATDRAHRIGQKNPVQIFRLITRRTIEEKIDHLKDIKKDLVDSVIKADQNPLSRLSEKELLSLFEDF